MTKRVAGSSSWTSLALACAILLAVIGPASLITAGSFEGAASRRALSVAAVAGVVCYVAATSSLAVAFAGNQLGIPVQGLLLGMLFRMGLPLAAIIAFGSQRTLGATIVVVYLLALVVETVLAVRMTPAKALDSKSDTATMANSTVSDSQMRPSVAS